MLNKKNQQKNILAMILIIFALITQAFGEDPWQINTTTNEGLTTGKKVCIGTTQNHGQLNVGGKIKAKEVEIVDAATLSNHPDYVFSEHYQLPTIKEIAKHIKEHQHLPDIPSSAKVKAEGIDILDMQQQLLKKIEELTLYTIDQQKRIESLKQTIQTRGENNEK